MGFSAGLGKKKNKPKTKNLRPVLGLCVFLLGIQNLPKTGPARVGGRTSTNTCPAWGGGEVPRTAQLQGGERGSPVSASALIVGLQLHWFLCLEEKAWLVPPGGWLRGGQGVQTGASDKVRHPGLCPPRHPREAPLGERKLSHPGWLLGLAQWPESPLRLTAGDRWVQGTAE